MSILLGVIADDFTGATDIANTLAKEGMRVVQMIGVPNEPAPENVDAVVVALKSRTAPVDDAVGQSLDALRWLSSHGARQIVFKYCSTFDSTPKGNIGPVADALQANLGAKPTIICPAFPENGRTVENGHILVNGAPLHESPMRDHPLTPMWDSDLKVLMGAQSSGTIGSIDLQTVRNGAVALEQALQNCMSDYVVVDATTDDDLRVIGHALSGASLITGGSGIATGLPRNFINAHRLAALHSPGLPTAKGRSLILAGSASVATQGQVAHAAAHIPSFQIEVDDVANTPNYTDAICAWAHDQPASLPVMIYGTTSDAVLRRNQEKYGASNAGDMLETTLSQTGKRLATEGFDRIIVAGGETSGAVISALGITSLQICREICPGVPWCATQAPLSYAIALKSGNFGQESFFMDALEILS